MLSECLAGLRVLDLSQYVPGPFATLMLADLGAEVVKIEPPRGDPMRSFGPVDDDGLTPFYKLLNRGKTVVRVDLKSAAGAAALATIIQGADVLLESFRPGAMERLGFGGARLKSLNPRLIHCALSGFGQSGAWRLRAGHDLTYMALTGGLAVSGTAEEPVMTFPPLADHAGAMQAASAILAALLRRERTGRGAQLDISLYETALSWQYLALTPSRRTGTAIGRETQILNGGAAYYRVYRCADGRFAALGAIEPKFWQAFCDYVGRPDWIARQGEALPQTALVEEVAALFKTQPLAHWTALLEPADCCFEPVLPPQVVPDLAHVRARGLLTEPGGGLVEMLFPALLDGQPQAPRRELAEETAEAVAARWG